MHRPRQRLPADRRGWPTLLVAAALLLVALATAPTTALATSRAAATHAGASALPQDRLHFGITNGPGDFSWMAASGVPWRYRYQYLAGGVNTPGRWETWQDPALPPGQFAVDYINQSHGAGIIPVLTYYELLQSNPSVGGDEATRDYNNLNNTSTMSAYYGDWKLLMQRAAAAGGTTVVHVEPDLWGYLENRAGNGTQPAASVSASVASSGFADVQGLPNTAQGFAFALLKMRDTYAPNVVLGIHASPWGNGRDIGVDTDPSLDAAAIGDTTAAFLNSEGISSNPFGSTWDVVFNDLDDHDAGWQEQHGVNHWWDPTNSTVPNFSRYLTWVGHLHSGTGRPQVAWQVPVGNQYYLTMNNTCGHYQDNVAEYFLSHPGSLSSAGLIAVLFGGGNPCTTQATDSVNDGVTNNNGVPTSDSQGRCNACNTHASTVADDDGGFLRNRVGAYYAVAPPPPPPPPPPPGPAQQGGYTLDSYGGVHAFNGAPNQPDAAHAYWPGWNIARAVAVCPGGAAGYTLDGYGGVHPFGGLPVVAEPHAYWPGWDIARGLALASCSPSGVSGYVLDGYGGIHPFRAGSAAQPSAVAASAYWSGWDIARGIALCPGGLGGYTLDGWGGLHPFGSAPGVDPGGYWQGWNIARGIVVTACDSVHAAGYTLDGWGGVHAFGTAAPVADNSHAYWQGWDIARGLVWDATYGGGYVADGYGGIHPFRPGAAAPPDIVPGGYWSGWDIVRGIGSG